MRIRQQLVAARQDIAERNARITKPAQKLDKRATIGKKDRTMNVIIEIMSYLWPNNNNKARLMLLVTMVFLVLGSLLQVLVPVLFGNVVDRISINRTPIILFPLGIIASYSLAHMCAQIVDVVRVTGFQRVREQAIRRMALNVFRHLHSLSFSFHTNGRSGATAQTFARGIHELESFFSQSIVQFAPTVFLLVISLFSIWAIYGLWYASLVVATVVTHILFSTGSSKLRTHRRENLVLSNSEAGSFFFDSLLNFETVKYFSTPNHEAARYDVHLSRVEREQIKSGTIWAFLSIVQITIISIGYFAILSISASEVVNGSMTAGRFIGLNALVLQLASPLYNFGLIYASLVQSLVDIKSFLGLSKVALEISDRSDAKLLRVSRGAIQFIGVGFGYEDGSQILHNINIKIPEKSTVAIVGPSGSGKTTILRLLTRFLQPNQGKILVDDQDISCVTQLSLRSQIGMVPQDILLFNDTIFQNIVYGLDNVTRSEVVAAAKAANIEDMIRSLPDGYDTIVGERGLKLSGGEKQRLGIARVLVRRPPIIVLDEATSALDVINESKVHDWLRHEPRDFTILVIAHRLSTVIDADKIIVVANGEVVEEGTFGELIGSAGTFAEMWVKQQRAH